MKKIIAGVVLGALLALPIGGSTSERHSKATVVGRFPCEEDEILKGTGDFDGRRWRRGWRCFHPDNLGS